MKTVVENVKLWKVEIDASGKLEFVLHGTGQKYHGQLSEQELEQICFRITEITKGVVSFEPPAQDLVNLAREYLETMAEQNETIDKLREDMKLAEQEFQELLDSHEAKTEPPTESVHNVQEPEVTYEQELAAIEKARLEAQQRQTEVTE